MQAVIISFQSLAANSLGCYGNHWIETPNWDRFAATGAIFDRHFADIVDPVSPEPQSGDQVIAGPGFAWATGTHGLLGQASPVIPIGRRLKSQGISTRLITADQPSAWQRQAEFDQIESIELDRSPDPKPDQVPFARIVKAGLAGWNDSSTKSNSRLIWLHSPGPGHPPKGFDSLYTEDFEERGVDFSTLTEEERASHPSLYGGSVSLLDHWLGEFLKGIKVDQEPTLIIVTAAQGFLWQKTKHPSLPQDDRFELCDQRIQTPLSLQVVGDSRSNTVRSLRSNRLVQTCDLIPTLLDWFEISQSPAEQPLIGRSWLHELTADDAPRSFLRFGNGQGVDAVRTADWLCIRRHDKRPASHRDDDQTNRTALLFAKPEDIWDVNDVASQQPETVDEMMKHLSPAVG